MNDDKNSRRVVGNITLSLDGRTTGAGGDHDMGWIRALLEAELLDRLSITLCPALVGGGARLLEDGLPASTWALTDTTMSASGAICLLYDRAS